MQVIRQDTDYGVRAALYLASASRQTVPCAEIARACGIGKSFAYKVMQKLAGAGIVASLSGRGGGFRLARDPTQVLLSDVVEAIQGPIEVSDCVLNPSVCERNGDCPLSAEWRRLQERIGALLGGTSLHDLVHFSGQAPPARATASD